jgi:sporulation protein YlmC with PRC-barrel domain
MRPAYQELRQDAGTEPHPARCTDTLVRDERILPMEQSMMNRSTDYDSSTGTASDLISSSKVEGTAVYNQAGDRLGTISHFMVGKRSGKVSYAVLEFGGFLGMGTDEYALPWEKLDYDVEKGGYVVDITKEQLNDAPRYSSDESESYDRSYYERVSGYYGYPGPAW